MKFDASQYETVKQRKRRFYTTHPEGRITVDLVSRDSIEDYALFRASVFLSPADQEKNLPRGVGFALEIRDKERPKNSYGKEYDSVNFTSWTENCEESAVGRALDNAGFFSDPKCSREEIEKAARQAQILSSLPNPAAKFEIPIGKNKGKTLDQLTRGEIESFIKWGEMQKDLKGPALDTVKEMKRFLEIK
jgi:hypothetical protein